MKRAMSAGVISAVALLGCHGHHGDGMPMGYLSGPGHDEMDYGQTSMVGIWSGHGTDSSGWGMGGMMGGGSMMGQGWMMGAGWMGEPAWHIEHHEDDHFDGWMSFSGYSGGERPRIRGTLVGATASFQIDMPVGSIPGDGCSATAHGTAQVEAAQLTATYAGANSCSGAFTDGRLELARR